MALVNLPKIGETATLKEVIDTVERMRKEIEFLFQNIEVDNLNASYVTVIEAGSNANGNYRKMSDGTLECWHIMSDILYNKLWYQVPIAGSTYFYIAEHWVYPVSFLSGSTVAVMASGDIGGVGPETHTAWHDSHTRARVESGIFGFDPTASGGAINRSYYARGRWK